MHTLTLNAQTSKEDIETPNHAMACVGWSLRMTGRSVIIMAFVFSHWSLCDNERGIA